jgi:hypothetical protein
LTSERHEKTALDDFLSAFASPESARHAFEAVPTKGDETNEAFAKFDSELVQVRKKVRYFNSATRTFYPSQRGVVEEYGVGATVPSDDGKKRVLPISLWLTERNPQVTTVTDVVYTPGQPARFKARDGDEHDTLNEWLPTELVPTQFRKHESVRPWLEFTEYISPDLTDEQREWWIDWMAYPLQHLGGKTRQAVLIWSEANGTGKNTVGNILTPMYGPANWLEIDGLSLTSKYNDWTMRQFVVINEVRAATYAERAAVMARLKTYVSQDRIDLDRKFLPRENVQNHLQLLLTSNHSDALLLDDDDRRFFVIKGPTKKAKWSEPQFKAFYAWLDDGGRERVFGFLLARKLDDFNPNAEAPRTAARYEMIHGAGNVFSDLIQLLCESPLQVIATRRLDDTVGVTPDFELFTPMRLIEHLNRYGREHNIRLPAITVRMLGSELSKRRVPRMEFEVPGRHKVTVYAILNADQWRKQPKREWRKHYDRYCVEALP